MGSSIFKTIRRQRGSKLIDTYLKNTEKPYLGESAFFHNNIDINTWYLSKQVDLLQKITLTFAFYYSSEDNKNKKPEDRIYAQNPTLMKQFGVSLPGVQSALKNMEKMGIIIRQYKSASGDFVKVDEAHGMTNRRVILDVNKIKDLLSTLYDEAEASGYKKRSREKRFLKRRPLSLIRNVINGIIKTQVLDLNARKTKLKNTYLKMQYKQFGDFNVAVDYDMEQTDKTLLSNLKSLLFDPPNVLLDANWTESN